MTTILNDRFKEIRKLLNLTQVQMAEKLEISQGTVTDIERGRIGVTNKIVQKLFLKLGVSSDWLYTGKGDIGNGNNFIELNTSRLPGTNSFSYAKIEGKLVKQYEKRDNVKKSLQAVRRQSILEIYEKHKKHGDFINTLINCCELIELLHDVSINYLDITKNDEDVISDIISGIRSMPNNSKFSLELIQHAAVFMPYSAEFENLKKSISNFLKTVKPIDTQDIIYL